MTIAGAVRLEMFQKVSGENEVNVITVNRLMGREDRKKIHKILFEIVVLNLHSRMGKRQLRCIYKFNTDTVLSSDGNAKS